MFRYMILLMAGMGLVTDVPRAFAEAPSKHQKQSSADQAEVKQTQHKPSLDEDLEQVATILVRIKAKPNSAILSSREPGYALLRRLASQWQDPRAEKALQDLAQSGPQILGPGGGLSFPTFAGRATSALRVISAKKAQAVMLKGADSPDEIIRRIEDYFLKNPESVKLSNERTEKTLLVDELVKTAQAKTGEKALRISIQADRLPAKFAAAHPNEFLQALKELTPKELADRTMLLNRLKSKELFELAGISPLLAEFSSRAQDSYYCGKLLDPLTKRPDGQTVLISLLEDQTSFVVRRAAVLLSVYFPNEQSKAALEKAIKLSVARGFSGEEPRRLPGGSLEVDFLRYQLNAVKQKISEMTD